MENATQAMMMPTINIQANRAATAFRDIRDMYPKHRIEEAELRAIIPLKNGTNTYRVNLTEGNGNTRPLFERLIGSNDAVGLYAYGVTVMKSAKDLSLLGNSKSYSYPDNQIFNAPGPPSEVDCLMAVFNSQMKLEANTSDVFSKMPVDRCYRAPNVQENSFSGPNGSTGAVIYDDNFVDIYTLHILTGKINNYVELNLGGYDTSLIQGADTENFNNFAIIRFKVFYIYEAAEDKMTRKLVKAYCPS